MFRKAVFGFLVDQYGETCEMLTGLRRPSNDDDGECFCHMRTSEVAEFVPRFRHPFHSERASIMEQSKISFENFSNASNDDESSNQASGTTTMVLICMSTCCVFGLYGNVVSALIFKHPIMRSPIDILLTGLSLIDLSLIILAVPVFVFPPMNAAFPSEFFEDILPFAACILYPLVMMAQSCSIWTFLIISIERYMAVAKPLRRHKLLTAWEAKAAQITVVVSAVLYNVVRFWEYELREKDERVLSEQLVRNDTVYFYLYYTALYQVTHFAVPFFIILLLNLFIVRSLSRAPVNLRRFSRSQIQQRKTSGMIVVITMMFAVSNLGPFILNIWEAIDRNLFEESSGLASIAYVLTDVSNCLVLLNSSTTFLIYLMCCRKYRLLFKFYGRFRTPPAGGQFLFGEENNVHCALVRAAYPLRAPIAYNLGLGTSEETQHRSDSTTYSSAGRNDNGDRNRS